jgi:hypothetical protein
VVRRNKFSLDLMSVTKDLMNERTKILIDGHKRLKGLVNSWEAKLRMMEEHYFLDE